MCGGQTGGDFGCPECSKSILGRKHGWIECKSTSFPGKVYYFHTATGCSTWQRPVPRNTQLPLYKKLRDLRYFESPSDDQILPSLLSVSGIECSAFSPDVSPSDFELHRRRMLIYLEKNTNYNLGATYEGGEALRDKLLEYYKTARSEPAKKLKEKKRQGESIKVSIVESAAKTRPIDPVKTIRECHGIKTVSYDPVPPELPIDVKMPDLSETSIDSFAPIEGLEESGIGDEKMLPGQGHAEGIDGQDQIFGRLVSKDLNLSESETTVSGPDFS